MSRFCKSCGAQLKSGAEFCISCGAEIKMVTNPVSQGPMSFIKKSMREGMDSLGQFFKSPKQWIPILVLGVFWLILSILPALGINPWPVRVISFLTFAQGGMYGGVFGAVGGIIGKAMFAYFVSALSMPLLSGKNPFKGIDKCLKDSFSEFVIRSPNQIGPFLLGIGLALIGFNFLTGNGSLVNSMAGIVGLILAIKFLWRKSGFVWGLLLSISNNLSKGRFPSQMKVSLIFAGYAVGSAIGVLLSAFPFSYLSYLVGGVFLIGGLIFSIIKTGEEATI